MHTDKDTSKNIGVPSAPLPEIDYSPKAHSRAREIMSGLKLIVAAAAFFLVIWLLESR